MHRSAFTLSPVPAPTRFAPVLTALAMLALISCAITTAVAQTYRWVDKDGVVHYSDQPEKGAEKIDLPSAQTYKAPPVPKSAPVRRTVAPATGATGSARCAITSPTPDQALVNVQSVDIGFAGPAGSLASVLLNGDPVQGQGAGPGITITPIARGSYSAVVVFKSTAGVEVCRTPSVTFHIRQASVRNPNRPR